MKKRVFAKVEYPWRWDYRGAYESGERLSASERVFATAEEALFDLRRESDQRTSTAVRVAYQLLEDAQRKRAEFEARTSYEVRHSNGSVVVVDVTTLVRAA